MKITGVSLLILVTCQSINAQDIHLNPSDSTVVMPVSKYRLIRNLIYNDLIVSDSLIRIIEDYKSLHAMNALVNNSLNDENEALKKNLVEKERYVNQINHNLDNCLRKNRRKNKVPFIGIGVGFIVILLVK